jgi:PHD/YefM family antitoxin component YafN of YafNO toxin-antitoxin module
MVRSLSFHFKNFQRGFMRIIKNSSVRVISVGGVRLLPGANHVNEKDIKDLKTLEHALKNHKDLSEVKVKVEDDLAKTLLGAMKAEDAIALVKETFESDKLKQLLEEESSEKNRKGVLAAIKEQIKLTEDAIKGDADKKDSQESDLDV